MRNIDEAEEWLDSWATSVDASAARAVELSRRVAELTGEARNRDGSITVAVGSTGQIVRLDLTAHPELARELTDLIARAQADLSAKVAAQVQDTVGADTETGRAVIHAYDERFPAPRPEDDEHRGR
ncbi:YbaB/EbfC family nucleoid-associated protein [Actinoplanes sp. NPDC051494]|uniref:YbaB/EbfC family nucleoid-associated protein n=1 Tax=Actinoplanes sp. NPDC051494 TaxID=3363907 RepID=UPI003795D886